MSQGIILEREMGNIESHPPDKPGSRCYYNVITLERLSPCCIHNQSSCTIKCMYTS